MGIVGAVEEDAHEAVGIRIGKRPQQHAVDDAEDRAIGADAERQRQHHHYCEAGILAQHAPRVAQVAPEIFDDIGASHIAAFLLNLGHATQLACGRAARFGGWHAGGQVLLRLLFQMETKFLCEIFLNVAAV